MDSILRIRPLDLLHLPVVPLRGRIVVPATPVSSIGALAVVLGLLAVPAVHAQETSARRAASAYLQDAVQERVATVDTLTQFRTELRPDGRFDLDARILRAEYRIEAATPLPDDAEGAALEYLRASEAKFGIRTPDEDLEVASVRRGHRSTHVSFRQTYRGLPVYNREVKVNLDVEGRPTLVVNGFAPHVPAAAGLETTPRLTAQAAAAITQRAGRDGLRTTAPELVVYPSDPPRLAWRMTAWPESGLAEWEVLVDAHTGEIIQLLDRSVHAHRIAGPGKYSAAGRLAALEEVAEGRSAAGESAVRVDGTGLVFDPDPLSSAGVTYGAPYVDGDDADIPELNAERKLVILRDLTQGSDGLYRLEGPYVIIDDGTRGLAYSPPAEATLDAFRYTRANDFFEAVTAYYHVDKSQRYVQGLDVGFAIKDEPILVNPHGFSTDDSQYQPGGNILLFGSGGIDDAEDADVIWHEYAHALMDFTAPGIINTGDGSALHEGWADYWAASYSRFLSEEDLEVPPHDWAHVFNWDGNTACWKGRTLDHTGHFPDETVIYPTSGCLSHGTIYQEGMLWATTLMEVYPQLGRTVLDRLNLASHAYLAPGVSFPDAAQAVIQADEDLYGGAHTGLLIDGFGARGYVDPAEFGPILTHEALGNMEQLGGFVTVEVTAVGATAAVDSVILFFGTNGVPSDRLILSPLGGDLYAGELPLPEEPGRVYYYIEAIDEEGRRRRRPTGAPMETYAFDVGPDQMAPAILHEPLEEVSVVGWPMDVYAEVLDEAGIDSVWVEYEILSSTGDTAAQGAFGLEETTGTYFARFPATAHKVVVGESVSYRIFARDASGSGNVSISPGDGAYEVRIVQEGVIRFYDFEGLAQGVHADGVWQRVEPSFGLRVAHSGSHVWATGGAAAYPASPQRSMLSLPPMDLSGVAEAYLVYWQWYDLEHDGGAEPGGFNATAELWDGANVKVSADGGETWSMAEPEGGYNGTIADQTGNPMGGENAFGGFSYGWRQEIVRLPAAPDVRVRFDFGTDDDNSDEALFFAGWFVDDVSVTSVYPPDVAPPSAGGLPPERTVLVPGQEDTPIISIQVDDDTGIETVRSEYTMFLEDGDVSGSIRLAMAETDIAVFDGSVVPPRSFKPGDRIEYRLRVRDFAGNEVVYPGSDDAFVVDYRASQQANALTSLTSTGAWHRQGATWATAGADARPSISSLVLEPFTLPSNSESAAFLLEHRFDLEPSAAGNVKISTDDGSTWTPLPPAGGYPRTYASEGHAMDGEGVFGGVSQGAETAVFNVSSYVGMQIRLRLDFAHPEPVAPASGWFVQAAAYESMSPDDAFETPQELRLHANFPDPFSDGTTITYSVPDRTPVRLAVYDMLGRRVALLRHVEQDAGIYTIQFDGSSLASGVYILYLETLQGNQMERMVVSR